MAFALAIPAASLRMQGAGKALPGVVGDQGGGFVQRAGGVAVAVGLDLLGAARGDSEQLRQGRDEAAGRVGVLDELAQECGEFLLVDVAGAEVVLDLLHGQGVDADRGADALQAGAAHRRPGRAVSQVVTAAAPIPIARWSAASSSIHALPGPLISLVTVLAT